MSEPLDLTPYDVPDPTIRRPLGLDPAFVARYRARRSTTSTPRLTSAAAGRRTALDPEFMAAYRARWSGVDTVDEDPVPLGERVVETGDVRPPAPELTRWQRWIVAAVTVLAIALGVAWAVLVPTAKVAAVVTWWALKAGLMLMVWVVIGLLAFVTLGALRAD